MLLLGWLTGDIWECGYEERGRGWMFESFLEVGWYGKWVKCTAGEKADMKIIVHQNA